MDLSLANKRAMVCGSTQGIGRACAHELARLGASITLVARDPAALDKVRGELPAPSGGPAHDILAVDFADPDRVGQLVERKAQDNGPSGPRGYDILINNTGGPPGGRAIDATGAAFLAAFNMHIVCNQVITRAVAPGMQARKWGRIINIISTSVKAPIPNLGVSNTIRAAVANWAKTLAGELGAHGITVNNVLPGYTDTDRLRALMAARAKASNKTEAQIADEWRATIPAARFGTAEEIANVVAFLASPAASYVNGINVPVDGGRLQGL